jgi:hypothetical protein
LRKKNSPRGERKHLQRDPPPSSSSLYTSIEKRHTSIRIGKRYTKKKKEEKALDPLPRHLSTRINQKVWRRPRNGYTNYTKTIIQNEHLKTSSNHLTSSKKKKLFCISIRERPLKMKVKDETFNHSCTPE